MKIKKILQTGMALLLVLAAGCVPIDSDNPYEGELNELRVRVIFPEGYEDSAAGGIEIEITDVNRKHRYRVKTDESGTAVISLTNGIYDVSADYHTEEDIFNGVSTGVALIDRDLELGINLIHSVPGIIVFKEIYCGGCLKDPEEGTYQYDKYIILHNNGSETEYLDGLCFGSLDPYNSQATNLWVETNADTGTVFPDFVPIIQCVWQFGGIGTTFPLGPGEDAVVALCGAIDHAAQYPLSVNLNRKDYFVCYNNTYFTNTFYHPAPGDMIRPDHYLNVVIKTGVANAYPFSVTSPAPVIFRAKDITIQEFILQPDNVVQKPGSNYDRVVKIPVDWVIDGVEVFYGGSSSNSKRLCADIDAGYVTQTGTYLGRSLHRKVDEQRSREAGYEILSDTNNSTKDFYERAEPSLRNK